MDFSQLPAWLPSQLYLPLLAASCLSCIAWVYLFFFRGGFWRTNIHLDLSDPGLPKSDFDDQDSWPDVRIIIPARNEEDILPRILPSILEQDYPGDYEVVLINDHSEDATEEVARRIAQDCDKSDRFHLIDSRPLPEGWTGKVWAMQQGVAFRTNERAESDNANPELLLFTDADIAHPSNSIKTLVGKMSADKRDLVSLMVHLRIESFWERLLIPPFVYFFAKLYPFKWVNDPDSGTAAAAGGCMLARRSALEVAGGLVRIHDQVIDDVALGQLIQDGADGTNRIWLGLTREIISTRPYESLKEIWDMVARTAFTQLKHSPLLLLGTLLGMLILYIWPVAGLVTACLLGASRQMALLIGLPSLAAFVLMACSFIPIVRWYRLSILYFLMLPIAGLLYTSMTLDSAWRYWRRSEGQWKGRRYG
jgi:hopene-associated glycosyltransferase HpnB